jgi:hypothetical protein
MEIDDPRIRRLDSLIKYGQKVGMTSHPDEDFADNG